MNVQHPDIKIRYIRTKNKTRKLVTYSSDALYRPFFLKGM